jgi:hypothetical protein
MKLRIKIFQCIILCISIILLKEAYTSKVKTNNGIKNNSKSLNRNMSKSKIRGFNYELRNEVHAEGKFFNNFNNSIFLISLILNNIYIK